MIRYSIKVSNDHQSLRESFETDRLILDVDDVALQEKIGNLVRKFNQPHEEVKITASMFA